ncbi:MAG: PaaI family thioesterase [Chloroflexia bacterium]|nr:PaaI family thioesterase [Chloroflexia bacterium]MDQ3513485.1 PaaI family thioesterase [Chloroflexota bacterium]
MMTSRDLAPGAPGNRTERGGDGPTGDGARESVVARDDHGCFGCGALNPHGLHLRFRITPEGIEAPFTPLVTHEGYTGMVHGGIVSTLLDEVMAWSLYRLDIWAVTAKMAVSFRRPVRVGEPCLAEGWLARDRGRLIETAARLVRVEDGTVLATATGTFARVPAARAQAWREQYVAPGRPIPETS